MVCAWVASLADFLLARQHSRPQCLSFLLVEWSYPLPLWFWGREWLARHVILPNFNRRS